MQLGPEPLPELFLLTDFTRDLKKSKSHQAAAFRSKAVTGLGNIYVDEALWEAKIHPEQSAATLE